ncbi:MAG: hypothetical protein CMJ78_09260 [Planctomycetaceae bacterium]|nr:hypothetical protein [Planctomycetaceae bacterium]
MQVFERPELLPAEPNIDPDVTSKLRWDFDRFATDGLPDELEAFILEEYGIDVSSEYAGYEIRNPWGKASGQLSMTARQVQEDVDAGLGFVVLKTVIAEDGAGEQTMAAWAIKESRMLVESIAGQNGETGWTVRWKGRGWWQSFDDYLRLIRDASDIAKSSDTLIVPSCKYHLPRPDETEWNRSEYEFTTRAMLEAWHSTDERPMPLEKDFSPTLAGSDLATVQTQILEWLEIVPSLIRYLGNVPVDNAQNKHAERAPVRIGLKVFNAMFDDEFQLRMLEKVHQTDAEPCDFYIHGNRLFDPDRDFDGHKGIAYGGPDLSDRNLRVMHEFARRRQNAGGLPWCATGNILSGRTAVEYALLGASSFQLHTGFQLPSEEYSMKVGNKTQKTLHKLYFHPTDGFIAWCLHVAGQKSLDHPIRFRDIVG